MTQNQNPTRTMREIPPEWDRLMRVVAAVNFGEIIVKVKNGKPYLVERSIPQIKLDNDQEFEDGLKTIPIV